MKPDSTLYSMKTMPEKVKEFFDTCETWAESNLIENLEDWWEYTTEDKTQLKELLKTTTIEPDYDLEWWMLGGILLNEGMARQGESGWDRRSDIILSLDKAIFTMPMRIDQTRRMLGVGTIEGQWGDEGGHIISSNWTKVLREGSNWAEEYTDGYTRFSGTTVEILLNTFASADLDDYPYELQQNPKMIKAFDYLIENLLVKLTYGILEMGANGFIEAKPYLIAWIKQNQNQYIEELKYQEKS